MKLKKIKLNELANAELNDHEMLRILGGGNDVGTCECGNEQDSANNVWQVTGYHGAMPMGEASNPNFCISYPVLNPSPPQGYCHNCTYIYGCNTLDTDCGVNHQ